MTPNYTEGEAPKLAAPKPDLEELLKRAALTPAEVAALFGKSKSWGYRRVYDETFRPIAGLPEMMIPTQQVKALLSKKDG